MSNPERNIDQSTVDGFGSEWSKFNYHSDGEDDIQRIFPDYFGMFPFATLPHGARCLDVGCGTGRWSLCAAPLVGEVHLLDASADALGVAKENFSRRRLTNVVFHHVDLESFSPDGNFDAAWSLGVLHHLPNTGLAIKKVASLLTAGAPFLVYLYYRFDNRPIWFKALWNMSNLMRLIVCRLPRVLRLLICDILALVVYWPIARMAQLMAYVGVSSNRIPLSYYSDKSFYVMRNDALDRFGTRLEQRFTRNEIQEMLEAAGFEKVCFSDKEPFWVALCYKRG